jgi:hypothetical protein
MKITSIALVLAAFASIAFAQSATPNEPPAVLQITREVIKEGRGAAHRRVEQDYANAFRRNNFPFHYLGLSTESGPNEALFLAAFPSFAAVEEGDKLGQKMPLKTELELVEARDGELRAESRTMTAVFRKDLSYLPANPLPVGKFRYMMIANYRVRLGQNEAFMAGAKVLLDGYRKANIDETVVCYQVIAGAPNGVYLFLIPMASLKDLDSAPSRDKALSDATGADAVARLQKGEGEVFQNMEATLYAISPEMSYMTKEQEDLDTGFWRPRTSVVRPASKDSTAKETAPKQ